jgi:hypothetical protein
VITDNLGGVCYRPMNLAMTSPTGIPEPSTWAKMLIGFADLAFVGYRARVRPANVSAQKSCALTPSSLSGRCVSQ